MVIHLFNGLVYGALLIVMCSGLALIYGLRRVVNFAHGSLYMLGAYLAYTSRCTATSGSRCRGGPRGHGGVRRLLDRCGLRCCRTAIRCRWCWSPSACC